MRLAALGLSHEANTFNPTGVRRLDDVTLHGAELSRRHAAARSTLSGYLAAADEDVAVVPLVFARTTPAGPIAAQAFDPLVEEMVTLLHRHGPWDGVLLALHGAAVAQNHPDADGEVLRQVRDAVGKDVPIGVSLDLHANVSPRMAGYADVMNTYQTNPHIDARERAAEVADLVVRTVRGQIRPTLALTQVPAVVDILRQLTSDPPMRDLLKAAQEVAAQPGVLSTSVVEGFPYADVAEMGMSTLVVTDGDPDRAQRHADELAVQVWDRRRDLAGSAPTPAEAVRRALATDTGPVLLLDVGDNVGGGSPGDSVVLLAEAQHQRLPGLLSIVQDPAAAASCHDVGIGGRVHLEVGGRLVPETGPPFPVEGTVLALHPGPFEEPGATHGGQRFFDTGPTALVQYDQDCLLVLTSRAEIPSGLGTVQRLGVDPTRRRAIIGKGVQSPLAGYGPIAAEIIRVDTPGITSADLGRLTYRHRRRPLYPFEAFPEEDR